MTDGKEPSAAPDGGQRWPRAFMAHTEHEEGAIREGAANLLHRKWLWGAFFRWIGYISLGLGVVLTARALGLLGFLAGGNAP